jgi:hypothetical protein
MAGLELDRDDRHRIKVVARTKRAVVVGARVPGREVDEPEVRIDGRRLPNRRAAVLPGIVVLRPSLVARLSGPRDRVEGPDESAVVGVVRLDAAARAAVGAREARDHEAVVVDGRRCDREIVLPALGLNRPDRLAGAAIERHEAAVELAHEDFVLADCDAAVVPPAAHRRDAGIEVGLVLPEDLARVERQREDVVRSRAHVRDAVMDDRLRFSRVLRREARAIEACAPDAFELRHVAAVDAIERRIALVVEVAAVRGPACRRRRDEPRGAEIIGRPLGLHRCRRQHRRRERGATNDFPHFASVARRCRCYGSVQPKCRCFGWTEP